MDNLLTKKPSQPQQDLIDVNKLISHIKLPNVPTEPNLKSKYEKAIIFGCRLMFSPETHKTLFLSQLKQNTELNQDLSDGIYHLILLILDRSGDLEPENKGKDKKIPGQIIIPIAIVFLLKAYDYLQKTNYPGLTPEVLGKAYTELLELILKKAGASTSQIPQLMQQYSSTQQEIANA